MVKWLVRYRSELAILVGAVLLVSIGLIGVTTRSLMEQYETVRHTTEVLIILDAILSAMTDAETGQRGFIITGDDRYLAPYTSAVSAADEALARLGIVTAGEPVRQGYAALLQPLVSAKLLEFKETIRLRQDGLEAAQRRMMTGTGLRLMDQLRQSIGALKMAERSQLTEQSTRHEWQARYVLLTVAALAAAALVVFFVLVVETGRRRREISRTRDALESQVSEHERTSSLLASLVQSSTGAIIGLDREGRVVTWNRGAERLYRFAEAEILGRPIDILFDAADRANVAAAVTKGPAVCSNSMSIRQEVLDAKLLDKFRVALTPDMIDYLVVATNQLVQGLYGTTPQETRHAHRGTAGGGPRALEPG